MPGTELETGNTKAVKVQSCPPRACPLASKWICRQTLTACGKCSEGEMHQVPLKHRRTVPNQGVVWVPGRPSVSVMCLKDSPNSETPFYSQSHCIAAKGYRLKSAEAKDTKGSIQERPGTSFQVFPPTPRPCGILRTVLNPSTSDMGFHRQHIADQGSSTKPWCLQLLLGVSPIGMEC